MDNCAIHHDEDIREIIEVECGQYTYSLNIYCVNFCLGAKLIYLPPYSSDFNPIEQAFHSIKSWLRRREAQAINANIRPWLIHQAVESVTPEMSRGWIYNCGYSFRADGDV